MAFCVPKAPEVKLITKNGIGQRVFINGNEIERVTDIDFTYGINDLPQVKITFLAKVEIEEEEVK